MFVRRVVVVVPLLGALFAAAVPLAQYVEKQRHEETAIEVLQHVRHAQQTFRQLWGGYTTDVDSLTTPCGSEKATLDEGALARLRENGYRLWIRPAAGAVALETRDCRGRPLSADYFVAAEPIDATVVAQQAFAARAEGDVHISYDGVAPDETLIANGLSTPLEQRSTFRIP